MKSPRIRLAASIALIVLLMVCLGAALHFQPHGSAGADASKRYFRLSDRLSTLQTVEGPAGEILFRFEKDGRETLQTAEEFAREIRMNEARRAQGGWFYRIFDITGTSGIFWVTLGLCGQLAFTGRMIVQWLVSEKRGQSVVPNVFWWMSLMGSSLLIAYFLWRVDVVGVLGQATGWIIYIRNLWLIYRRGKEVAR